VAQTSLFIVPMRTAAKKNLIDILDRVEWLPDREFRQFEYGLVVYYRRNESAQERIASALLRRSVASPREHVHDPMVR